MNFHHDSVCSHCNSSSGQWGDISPYTGSVAGINDHWQMALGADHRDSADIQSISGGCLVGADAAFTENDVWIAFGNDILSGI